MSTAPSCKPSPPPEAGDFPPACSVFPGATHLNGVPLCESARRAARVVLRALLPWVVPLSTWAAGTRGLISLEERQADASTGRQPYTVLVAMMDKEAWQDYQDSIAEFPIPLPNMVQLDVVYVDGAVIDAIVNNSASAFTTAPAPTPATQP